MLRYARTVAIARIAAALIGLSLSGLPRVIAMHAPVEGHHCSCKQDAHGHHTCSCVLCWRAALSAKASDKKLPPCHQAAARAALASEEGGRDAGVPGVEGNCGAGGRQPVSLVGVEPFCLLPMSSLTLALTEEAHRVGAARPQQRALEPETPPPRQS